MSALDQEAAALRTKKTDALKELTEEMGLLLHQRQSLTGNLPGQLALDVQLKSVQEKIDQQSEEFDRQLKAIADKRTEIMSRFNAEQAQIESRRSAETAELQSQLAKAKQDLEALVDADKQSANKLP